MLLIFYATYLISFSKGLSFPRLLAKQSLYLIAPRQKGFGAIFDLGFIAASLFKVILTELLKHKNCNSIM